MLSVDPLKLARTVTKWYFMEQFSHCGQQKL